MKKILYATGGISIGMYFLEEHYRDLIFLYNSSEKFNYKFIIKPHPAEHKSKLIEVKKF